MKIVQINTICGGSTGKIAHCIGKYLDNNGIENYLLFSYGDAKESKDIKFSNKADVKLNALKSRLSGNYGFYSQKATKRLIAEIERIKPDIIHIHNVHGHDLDLEMFCSYLKDKKVVWTLHDCWLFTGYCPHYTFARCGNWEKECRACPLRKNYSWFFDHSSQNYLRKKKSLLGINNLTLVTPSKWLQKQVAKSFLKDKPLYVIPNGIDLSLFRPDQQIEQEKKIVLGVGFPFGEKKGISDVISLSELLPDEYKIVIIGGKKQSFPEKTEVIPKTENQQKLVQYYSNAHVLINPTHEDNYPTVNLEAIACGTPVITYDVGGSPESITPETGIVIPENDIIYMAKAIQSIQPNRAMCRKHAEECFSDKFMAEKYFDLYQNI